MSYNETEYPAIIKRLKSFVELYNNPGLISKLVDEVYRNYKYIPLYPGIIHDTLRKMVREVPINEVKEHDWVAFEYNGKKYSGIVKEIKDGEIEFEQVTEVENKDNLRLSQSEVKGMVVVKINEHQLEEDWPMLIYEEKLNVSDKLLK